MPPIESLECRRLFSVGFSPVLPRVALRAGTLAILGTAGNDVIAVGNITGAAGDAEIVVAANGHRHYFAAQHVKRIFVVAGHGNDYVDTAPAPALDRVLQTDGAIPVTVPVVINGGFGNDTHRFQRPRHPDRWPW